MQSVSHALDDLFVISLHDLRMSWGKLASRAQSFIGLKRELFGLELGAQGLMKTACVDACWHLRLLTRGFTALSLSS